ncbi:MAG: GNAT family N-acetyltransferase, partial [Candidatus Bathyarchaeota archaeon]|nr:GNAT family N-acetyltransferase [Candidatus Bathyarchaeota archaeon]
DSGWQHMGWGRRLLEEAEKVVLEEHGVKKLYVMSALGTKEYYAKWGYTRDGAYVSKRLPEKNI